MSSKILLRGVFVNHLIKSKDDTTIRQVISNNEAAFTEIEKDFDDVESCTVPHKICWYCGLYDNECVAITISRIVDVRNEMDNDYKLHHNLPDACTKIGAVKERTIGNFCTVFCAARFLQETADISEQCKSRYKSFLYYTLQKKLGKPIYHIPLAYPRYYMKAYSGEGGWSEDEYKRLTVPILRVFRHGQWLGATLRPEYVYYICKYGHQDKYLEFLKVFRFSQKLTAFAIKGKLRRSIEPNVVLARDDVFYIGTIGNMVTTKYFMKSSQHRDTYIVAACVADKIRTVKYLLKNHREFVDLARVLAHACVNDAKRVVAELLPQVPCQCGLPWEKHTIF